MVQFNLPKHSKIKKGNYFKFEKSSKNLKKIKNYGGETIIQPGAFKYKSPCPPSGSHTYEWTITAIGEKKKKLGKAKATREYPE